MNPMLAAWLGAALRQLIGPLLTYIGLRIGMDEGDTSMATAAVVGLVLNMAWVLWVKYKDRLKFLTALASPSGTPEETVKSMMKINPPSVLGLLLALSLIAPGCAARTAPIVVAQSTLGIAQTIGQLQESAITLQKTGVIDARTALKVQDKLQAVNKRVEQIIPYLEFIDRLQRSGVKPTATELDAMITQVFLLLQEFNLVAVEVPVADATRTFLDAFRAFQTTLTTTMIELARVRVALGS